MECSDVEMAKFLELFYIAMDDRKLLSTIYSGLRNTIPKDRFLGAKMPIPPATERAAILDTIGRNTAALNLSIARLEREIELLREYRTRLIADVVTGKLDVRTAAAQLPDEDPLRAFAPSREPAPDDDPLDEAADEETIA
jgi:type I restriction enzyme S subunit